jgi:hypothetical protein
MTSPRHPKDALTIHRRLALSRQALAQGLVEPLWAGVVRAVIQRYLKRQDLKRDQIR